MKCDTTLGLTPIFVALLLSAAECLAGPSGGAIRKAGDPHFDPQVDGVAQQTVTVSADTKAIRNGPQTATVFGGAVRKTGDAHFDPQLDSVTSTPETFTVSEGTKVASYADAPQMATASAGAVRKAGDPHFDPQLDSVTSTSEALTVPADTNVTSTGHEQVPRMASASGGVVRTSGDPHLDMQVSIDNFSFSPETLTVPVGTKVTWINHDDVPHTATSRDKPRAFNSGALDTDQKFSYVFAAPGTYPYFCAVHPHMTGQIIVK